MPVTSRFSRCLPLLALLGAAGCPEPTEPPTRLSPVALDREWEFIVQPHDADTVSVGGVHGQDVGVVSDLEDFGSTIVHVAGRDPIGKAEVFSNATGSTYWVEAQSPFARATNNFIEGAGAILGHEYAFVIDSGNPSVKFTITAITLDGMDYNPHLPTPEECMMIPGSNYQESCTPPILAGDLFSIYAFPNLKPVVLSQQGTVVLQGYIQDWTFSVGTEDGDDAPFSAEDFDFTTDLDGPGTGTHAQLKLKSPIPIPIPLDGMVAGDTLVVETAVLAWAEDRRQAEDFSGAYFRDPVSPLGVDIELHGVHRIASLPSTRHVQLPAPACSGAPTGTAGTLQFSAPQFFTGERGLFGGKVTVSRTGGTTGLVSATVTTGGGSATAGVDYSPVTTVVRFGDGQGGTRTVRIPLHGDHVIEPDETVNLTLSDPRGCAALGSQAVTVLHIRDDDNQPPPPSTYSVGGTVTGLAGTGLQLLEARSGFQLTPGNGPFTIVPSRADSADYEVRVTAQPTNPLQVCSVANASGRIAGANVTDVAVDCATPSPSGALDPTFGSGGRVAASLLGGATAMALQPDGKIVVVGESKVERFNADGSPDQGFGSGGQADFTFPGTFSNSPQGVVIQPDGRIVVAGYIRSNARDDFVVVRYNANGSLDTGFGGGGQVITDFASLSARAWAVALQNDGQIVIAGQAALGQLVSPDNDFALARYTSAGTLDPTFGSGGKVTTNIGGKADWANALRIQGDGKIVLAGRSAVDGGSDPDIALVRYNTDGTPDRGFGSAGVAKTDLGLGSGWKEAFDLVVQSDGKIVIAGQASITGQFNFLLARLDATGALDQGFGTVGVTTTAFTSQGDVGRSIALQADGKIVVGGRVAFLGTSDFGVARYTGAGALDSGFGTAGKMIVDFFTSLDGIEALAIQPDGMVVAAGFARNGASTGLGMVRVVP